MIKHATDENLVKFKKSVDDSLKVKLSEKMHDIKVSTANDMFNYSKK